MQIFDMNNWIRCAGALALATTLSIPAAAQESEQDPVLPDIAPRVVEIRGQLEISLPSLQRQPLIGFNPPPRVAPIPPEREPFVEAYKQESIDLPPSPLQAPEPPPVATLIGQAPRSGRLTATVGRYFSRGVEFKSEWPMSQRSAIYSKADYKGTDGHESEDAPEDASSSYDALDALVGVQFDSDVATFGVEVDGFLNQYLLYGAAPSQGAGHLTDEPPTRDGRGGGISAWTRTQADESVDVGLRLRYGVATYETDALADGAGSANEFLRDERSFDASVHIAAPLTAGQTVRTDIEYTFLDLDNSPAGSADHMLDGAGGLTLSLGRAVQLTALGRLMTFMTEDSEVETFVAPDLSLDLYPGTGVRLYLQNRPRSVHHTTASSMRENPYLIEAFLVQPTVFTLDARGGGRFVAGVFEADVHAGYSRAPNYRFFERASSTEAGGFAQGFIATRYDGATIYYGGGDISVILPAGFALSVGLTVREGNLEDDEPIPYFGPILGRGALSYAFAAGRGYVQASTTYESSREVARGNVRKIGDYFDLDIEASYDITPYIGVLVQMENLSAGYLERWEHYDKPPFVIGAGLQLRW